MEDTIAAIATAFGEGGIGIVRISGTKAGQILNDLFLPKSLQDATHIVNRQLTYGHIIDPYNKTVVDEVMAVFLKSPFTYTKEDVVEIQCHGSVVSLRKILSLVLNRGARLAEPGEFTKRAFLNGRIDLSQAEAVIDLIRAKTERSFDTAMSQLEGKLSQRIKDLRKQLMDILVKLAVNIDYPDEDIEEFTYKELIERLSLIGDELDALISSADTGRIIREGLRITIVGRPNVGKSSLLNALLREQRAIVTEIPGTTRDTIEEGFSLDGIPVFLTDTAGIRPTDDPIEQIGIARSRAAFDKADLIVFMVDGSQPLTDEDLSIAGSIGSRKVIIMLNKTDLGKRAAPVQLEEILPFAKFVDAAVIEEKGIRELEEIILSLIYSGAVFQSDSDIITNARHKDLLVMARKDLTDAIIMACQFEALDFIEVDVRHAWELLGDIIGETVSEDIIDAVFQRFCLGK
ncbi:MAG TPA: tRNA uridine-5-carboxymethylaminomethyl(34) synthesis GTPase MnmE [Bacillota bacterium]|jgi:tRNA modification GTPase|nr:tRNA uridine-5-carboxymethylaminomethyl(34) synthesis GTPase MnmE [Bacillota bacterium]